MIGWITIKYVYSVYTIYYVVKLKIVIKMYTIEISTLDKIFENSQNFRDFKIPCVLFVDQEMAHYLAH